MIPSLEILPFAKQVAGFGLLTRGTVARAVILAAVMLAPRWDALADSIGPNLVVNGSFEMPVVPVGSFVNFPTGSTAIPGWTVVGAPGDVSVASSSYTQDGFTFSAGDGNQWLNLSGFGSNAVVGVEQDIPTIPGQTYAFSYMLGSNVGNAIPPDNGPIAIVFVIANGNLSADANTGGNPELWQTNNGEFTANSDSTEIEFLNAMPTSVFPPFVPSLAIDCGLDDVFVGQITSSVPEPSSLLMLGTGLLALAGLSLKKSIA